MRRYGAWIALVLLIPYLQFIGGGWFGIYASQIRIASLVLLVAVFSAWALAAWRQSAWRPQSALMPALVAAIGSLAISTILSRQPRISVEYLGYAVVLAGLYLLLVQLLRDRFLGRRIASLSVLLGLIPALAFLIAVAQRWTEWWALVGRVTFPPLRPAFESFVYGNPSSVMAVVVLFLPSSLAVIAGSGKVRVAGAAILLGLAAAVTVTSGSRAGWLALAFAGLVIVLVAAAHRSAREAVLGRIRGFLASRSGEALAFATVTLGIAGGAVLGPGIFRRALEGGENVRGAFVTASLRMFAEAPIVGTGPGTWVTQRIRYTQAPETDYYIPHAHNVYAQTLSELGVVGAVVGLVLVAAILRLVIRAIRNDDPWRRRWGWAALAVSVYFAAHSTLDFFMNMPAILFPLALPIAMLDASAPANVQARGSTARHSTVGLVLGGAALAAALVLLFRLERPALQNQQAVEAGNDGRWSAAVELAKEAVATDPDIPALRMTLGIVLSRTGAHGDAAVEFEKVAGSDDLPEAWLNLAAELADLGQPDAAIDAVRRALRLGYQRPAIAMPAGDLALRLGNSELARQAFAAALAANSTLGSDPWWLAEPARAAILPGAIEGAIRQADASYVWEVALLAGEPERATVLASDSTDPDLARTVVFAWSGDTSAVDAVFQRCDETPLDLGPLAWCGRLASKLGDGGAALRYRSWAGYIVGGSEEAGSLVHVAAADRTGRWLAGGPATFWGYYTYRRPIPWNPLVPSLIHLEME